MKHKIILLFLFFGFLFLVSCENKEMIVQKVKEVKMRRAEIAQIVKEALYREKAVLLSMKYKVKENKVFNILQEYEGYVNKILDFIENTGKEDLKKLKWKEIFDKKGEGSKNKIISLSKKHTISSDKIASILIDYYSMEGHYLR